MFNKLLIPAFEFFLVDGRWSGWSAWSPCSVTCGNGRQERTRRCDTPVPEYGGKFCDGPAKEYHNCEEDDCPGNFTVTVLFVELDEVDLRSKNKLILEQGLLCLLRDTMPVNFQELKKIPSGSPGKVDFSCWASNFQSLLNQCIDKPPSNQTMILASKKWPRLSKIWELLAKGTSFF